ncbi:hypothetical protein CEUSTIGMA_g622.t1 [Chlamydomonas eustigma]|uniref:Uncharacterized protein n=1 Tax=Chlamydomonas eustigma TaxID=1157962 RepID=A0A250WR48_9CHLO|nr:hypothetical protein CEUSTIGMA_g622.t1 [Chlamydomonas eustigma]|eukprot:GAX73169.1 hypothetical protein CEUSTIGMA_g622.t1 [Chlamydomonas eustigma]
MYELHNAARNGDVEGFQTLLVAGANLNDKDNLSRTPLHLAAWSGQTDLVRILIAHNAQLNAVASDDMNALHFCAMKGHWETSGVLITAGLHVDSRTRKGLTPLAMAAQAGHVELAKYLLKRKANPLAVNKRDQSVLDLCKSEEMREVIQSGIRANAELKVKQEAKQAEKHEEHGLKKRDRGHVRGIKERPGQENHDVSSPNEDHADGNTGNGISAPSQDLDSAVALTTDSERAEQVPIVKKHKALVSFGDED